MHSLSSTFQNILIQVHLHGTIGLIQNSGAISFLPVWKNSSGNTARLLLHEALSLEEVGTKTYLLLYLFLECVPWPFQNINIFPNILQVSKWCTMSGCLAAS